MSPLAIRKFVGAAIGTALALVAIATALIVSAILPGVDGKVIAIATGVGIGVAAVAVAGATVLLAGLSLPSRNDGWSFP